MSTYRVVLKRTVITHENFIVQGNDEDEAMENAMAGHYPVVSTDLQDSHVEIMTTEEMK
jgi:Ca2+/H+ antiporter